MQRTLLQFAGLLLVVTGVAACGVPTQQVAHPLPDKDVPSGLLSTGAPTTTTVPTGQQTAVTTICLAQSSGGPLKAVTRQLPMAVSVEGLLQELARPPTQSEQQEGLETALTPGITGTVEAGVATVALNSDFASDSGANQLVAVAQIVCTLTARPGVGQVQFELSGMTTDVPRGDGSATSGPVSRDDYPQLMPPPSL